ncbi:MAG TPA: GNAT family N-acetyltransferase [Candidatus Kapabacteria bacterium]|nr:GNAT family N-acetyltransferase [Candidatus Kapabacteria bacterium]
MKSLPASYSVRVASIADIPAIVALVNVAFNVEIFLEGVRTDEKNVIELMQKGQFFLMEENSSRIIASIYMELRGERGYFGMLAVEPSRQGQGLGRAMIEFAEEYCREHGCTIMDLKVLSPRKELPPYYEKLGYTNMGTDEFRPSRPIKPGIECHLILMSKPL